jgi:anti-sigma regulatory factor (Ser/Thr protein kinase)
MIATTAATAAPAPEAFAQSFWWQADTETPRDGRRALRRYLDQAGGPAAALLGDAEVIVSELLTNALRAYQAAPGRGPGIPGHCCLRLELAGHGLLIEVSDWAPGLPDWGAEPDYISETGRGLHAVKHLADGHCGHYRTAGGKSVWAALPLPATVHLDEPAPAVTGLRRTA